MAHADQDYILSRLHNAAQGIISSSNYKPFRTSIPFVGGIETDTFPHSITGAAFEYSQCIGHMTPMVRDVALQHKYVIVSEMLRVPVGIRPHGTQKHCIIPLDFGSFVSVVEGNKSQLIIPMKDTMALTEEAKQEPASAMFIEFIKQGVLVVKVRFIDSTQFLLSGCVKQNE